MEDCQVEVTQQEVFARKVGALLDEAREQGLTVTVLESGDGRRILIFEDNAHPGSVMAYVRL